MTSVSTGRLRATKLPLALLLTTSALSLALHSVAMAAGGMGGGYGGAGGTGYNGMAGGDAVDVNHVHAGGGGGGAGGGLGGAGGPGQGSSDKNGAGGRGGDGGYNNQNGGITGDGQAGSNGGASDEKGSGGGSGGGGGAGGAGFLFTIGITDLADSAAASIINGGKGGAGGKGFPRGGAGGKGGDGGGGVVMADGLSVTVTTDTITGGDGGRGGDGADKADKGPASADVSTGARGGDGGAGVIVVGGGVSVQHGSITGGDGGAGGNAGKIVEGATAGNGGNGGAGIDAAGTGSVVVATGTTVAGGDGGAGGNGGAETTDPAIDDIPGDGGSGGAGISFAGAGSVVVAAGASVVGGKGGAAGTGNDDVAGTVGDGGAGIKASGGTSVTVAGTVTGGMDGIDGDRAHAIDLIGGGNTLTLEQGYAFKGVVVSDGAGDGDALRLGGGTDDSFDLWAIGNSFAGFSTFGKEGSSIWTLTGTTDFSGDTMINDGTLVVNGSLADSAITVSSGGTLAGIGTVGATEVNAGGVIAPGDDGIGTLSVDGLMSFASGSTYALDLGASGNSDRIVVTGNAVLGGTVAISFTPDFSPSALTPSEYTILTASSGHSGAFAGLDVPDFAFFDADLDYSDSEAVKLTVARNARDFEDVAKDGDQSNAAAAIESLGASNPLFTAVLGMSEEDAQDAFAQLSGAGASAAAQGQAQVAGLVTNSVLERIDAAFDKIDDVGASGYMPATTTDGAAARSIWLSGYGARATVDASGPNAASSTDSAGLAFGLDGALGDWTVGLMGGYGRAAGTVSALGTSIESSDYSAGLYAGADWDSVRLSLGGIYTLSAVTSTRDVTLPTPQTLTADYTAGTASVFGEIANEVDLGVISLTPYVGAQYVRNTGAAYTEQGGSAALSVAERTSNTLNTTIGLRSSAGFVVGGDMLLTLGAGAGWKHAFADQPTITQSFVAGGNSFTVAGAPVAADRLAVEASMGLDISANLVIGLDYAGEITSNAQTHQIQAGVKGSF